MRQPEISVVVPVYNTAPYLEQCILSIIHQTFQNIEIICVNDGSTDRSPDILERLASQDSRISVIHREKASGSAAVPRNIGIDHASGKYIIFLDSDDYFDLQMFEKMYDCAEKKKADLVMCDNYVVSSADGSIKNYDGELHHAFIKQKGVFSYKDIPDTIFQISNAAIWHKLISIDTLVKYQLKFQERVPILDDIFFVNLLLVLSKRIYILDEKLVFYREFRMEGQTSAVAKYKESIYLVFEKLNEYLEKTNFYNEIKKSFQNWTIKTLEWWYYTVKEFQQERELYFLYKNSYFEKLGLMHIKAEDISQSKDFYDYVLYEDYRPSVSVILNSVSSKGAKIVLYGAGKLGKNVYEYIMRNELNHTIKLWCDKNAEKMEGLFIQKPEKIKDVEFDVLLVAIRDETSVSEVKNYLKKLGVDKDKIYAV